MIIIKTKDFILRPLKMSDKKSLTKYVNKKEIIDRLLVLPYPYTIQDAAKWIKKCQNNARSKHPKNIVFGIEIDGCIVGSIGIHKIENKHKAEIGYWLGKEYWGNGIMPRVVKEIVDFCFKNLKIKRIYAKVFLSNEASRRVLEKSGFKLEGILRKEENKKGRLIDVYMMSKIK